MLIKFNFGQFCSPHDRFCSTSTKFATMLILRLIRESFSFAFQAIVAHKLRTLLSLLGVTIGIFSIIAVFTLVDTMKLSLEDSFDMLEDDVIFVQKMPWAPEPGEEYEWWKYIQREQPTMQHMDLLNERLTTHEAISFQSGKSATVERRNSFAKNTSLMSVSHDYKDVMKVKLQDGRYFTQLESKAGRNMGIIGSDIAQSLFPGQEPIGKDIKVNGLKVTVIGVFQKEGNSMIGQTFDRVVMVPAVFGARLINYRETDVSLGIKAREGVSMQELKNDVVANMRSLRSLRPGDENDFAVNESTLISKTLDEVFGYVNSIGFFIGFFAILVGGFSIANIMFVSVKERTRIIGIQKSLGAKNYFIMLQFLFESVLLCLFGGLIGLGLIALIVGIVNLMPVDFKIGWFWSNFFIGISISLAIGLISGVLPARTASNLNPVVAIRSN